MIDYSLISINRPTTCHQGFSYQMKALSTLKRVYMYLVVSFTSIACRRDTRSSQLSNRTSDGESNTPESSTGSSSKSESPDVPVIRDTRAAALARAIAEENFEDPPVR